MKTYTNLYCYLSSVANLTLAWRKARKNKTKKPDIIKFEEDLIKNLVNLHYELKNKTYKPKSLKTFILRDPKTRKISKSDFRDRVIHHAVINIIGPIFQKSFIYDSCANQKKKGTILAIKRFEKFRRKVTDNFTSEAYCLKADIKHYFQEVDHNTLLKIISKKIKDEDVLLLIEKIVANSPNAERERAILKRECH